MDGGSTETISISSGILEEMSGTELNDRIISLPIFKCQKCLNILRPPIILVKDIGNICGTCKLNYDDNLGSHNSALEAVLHNLVIPCRNHQHGCKEKLNFTDISKHESICSCRIYYCPLKLLQKCMWEGSLSMLQNHFTENHTGDVKIGRNYFRLDIDTSKNAEMIKLLCNTNNKFILHIKCNLPEWKLQLVMYHIKDEKNTLEFSYRVRTEICGSKYSQVKKTVFEDKYFTGNFNTSEVLNIDLSVVKQFEGKANSVSTSVEIVLKGPCLEELNVKSLKIFECPICYNYMKPPIHQCLLGHSLCNNCKLHLTQCPTCRANYGNTRNFALEEHSNNVRFPCIYRNQGCGIILPGYEIHEHEQECLLKLHQCPYSNTCIWQGSYYEIVYHLETHDVNVIRDRQHLSCINLNAKNVKYYMFIHDRIFGVYFNFNPGNKKASWRVQLIGPKRDAKMFKYEIGLIDSKNVDKKLIRTEICHFTCTNCIQIPHETIIQFLNENRYVVTYCKILKIVNNSQKKQLIAWLSEQKQQEVNNGSISTENKRTTCISYST